MSVRRWFHYASVALTRAGRLRRSRFGWLEGPYYPELTGSGTFRLSDSDTGLRFDVTGSGTYQIGNSGTGDKVAYKPAFRNARSHPQRFVLGDP